MGSDVAELLRRLERERDALMLVYRIMGRLPHPQDPRDAIEYERIVNRIPELHRAIFRLRSGESVRRALYA